MAATTLEVRWIVPGSVPGDVERWLGPAAVIEDREDRYLHDRPSELGLKVRDGRELHVAGAAVVEHPFDDGDRPACDVELTDLWVGDARWWTFALDAVGPDEGLELELRASADRLFAEPPPRTFDLSSSRSYAASLGTRDPGSRPRVRIPHLGFAIG
jgi:hypothetical protein